MWVTSAYIVRTTSGGTLIIQDQAKKVSTSVCFMWCSNKCFATDTLERWRDNSREAIWVLHYLYFVEDVLTFKF